MTRPPGSIARHWGALTWAPEFNVAVFALLLNFPWELLQVPLFTGMADARHGEAVKTCSRATLGDALIMLVAYAAVSAVAGSRRWIMSASRSQLALFVGVGVSITVAIEWLALHGRWFDGWSYAPSMPVVPGIGIGLSPILQWIVLPLLLVWFVRRQIGPRGSTP